MVHLEEQIGIDTRSDFFPFHFHCLSNDPLSRLKIAGVGDEILSVIFSSVGIFDCFDLIGFNV
jgi:hypothetical protein